LGGDGDVLGFAQTSHLRWVTSFVNSRFVVIIQPRLSFFLHYYYYYYYYYYYFHLSWMGLGIRMAVGFLALVGEEMKCYKSYLKYCYFLATAPLWVLI